MNEQRYIAELMMCLRVRDDRFAPRRFAGYSLHQPSVGELRRQEPRRQPRVAWILLTRAAQLDTVPIASCHVDA